MPTGCMRRMRSGLSVESQEFRSAGMKFSIRRRFAFEFSLAIPYFWKRQPARIAADYELERFFIAGFEYHDGPDLVKRAGGRDGARPDPRAGQSSRPAGRSLSSRGISSGLHSAQRNRTIAALLDQAHRFAQDYPV